MTTKNLLLNILQQRRDSMLRQRHDRAMFTYSEIADMADFASADAAALRGAQTIAEQARNERDAAVQANERKERELVELQRKLDDLQDSVKHVKFERNSLRDGLVAAQGFCDKLRNENNVLRSCLKTLPLKPKPMQYGAGGAANGCNNSIDAAKAQTSKPDFVKLCRDQLDTCLRDGSWIGYAELRNYVTHTATYGEQDQ